MTAFRFSLALLLCGISIGILPAQPPRPRGNGGASPQARAPRPQPQLNGPQAVAPGARPIAPLNDPVLRKILDDWGNHSAQIRELRGTHERFVFEKVFMTETRSKGHFYFEAPDKGRIDLVPDEVKKGDKSRMEGYTLRPDHSERWICDGFKITTMNDEKKEFEQFDLPVEMRGQNIINGPLPFLFGLKALEAHQRYELTLKRFDEKTGTAVILAIPRRSDDQANYSEATIILDTNTNLPTAVRLVDPVGNRVTEYWFKNMQPNAAGLRQAVEKMMGRDPFHPDVRGYKTVQSPAGNGPPREGNAAPAPRNAGVPADGRGKVRLE